MRSAPLLRRAPGPPMSRRAVLLGAAASGILAACGDGSSTSTPPGDARPDDVRFDEDYLLLQAGFADGLRVPSTLISGSPQRAPFVLFGADAQPAVNTTPMSLSGELVAPDGTRTPVALERRGSGIPTPYYPLVFEPAASGQYRLEADVEGDLQVVEFLVAEPGDVALVQVGDAMRQVDTPTVSDLQGYTTLCTRFEPCPFHSISLTDALTNGRATMLMISTPGFCQTAICGPVLELLIDADPGPAVNVLHVEVYTDPGRLAEVTEISELLGPVVTAYGMDFEPSLVIADATGTVTARLDYTFDATELAAVLPSA